MKVFVATNQGEWKHFTVCHNVPNSIVSKLMSLYMEFTSRLILEQSNMQILYLVSLDSHFKYGRL